MPFVTRKKAKRHIDAIRFAPTHRASSLFGFAVLLFEIAAGQISTIEDIGARSNIRR